MTPNTMEDPLISVEGYIVSIRRCKITDVTAGNN
jgi:hypothetical protein